MAHELATVWGGTVYSLNAQPQLLLGPDPLPVLYPRQLVPRFQGGRLLLPYLSRVFLRLLLSQEPLHGHLPSPAVLLTLVLVMAVMMSWGVRGRPLRAAYAILRIAERLAS